MRQTINQIKLLPDPDRVLGAYAKGKANSYEIGYNAFHRIHQRVLMTNVFGGGKYPTTQDPTDFGSALSSGVLPIFQGGTPAPILVPYIHQLILHIGLVPLGAGMGDTHTQSNICDANSEGTHMSHPPFKTLLVEEDASLHWVSSKIFCTYVISPRRHHMVMFCIHPQMEYVYNGVSPPETNIGG